MNIRNDSGGVRLDARRADARVTAAPGRASQWPAALMLLLALLVNVMVAGHVNVPFVRPGLGFWFILILPAYLVYTTSLWERCEPEERLAYSVCAVILALMLGGLAINTLLPLLGVQRPLGTDKVLLLSDLLNLAAYLVRRRHPDVPAWRDSLDAIGRQELRLLVLAASSVVLAVLGANRLNNGAGDQVTLLALAVVIPTFLLALRWINLVRETAASATVYLISLSLLLTTSLRGWSVTGHDIQEEYHVFQVTAAHARWSMSYFQDAYNACLSITILPTELARVLDVDDPYVFKLFFQIIFALCPVFVYGIARRYFKRSTSILAVAYFVGFPTFFTDMPFLNRQEIGFLFVTGGALVVTNQFWRIRRRQLTLVAIGIGVEVSHYSSMYVFVGVLAIAWLCRNLATLLASLRARPARARRDGGGRAGLTAKGRGTATLVTLAPIVVLAGIVVLWGGVVTGTSGQVLSAGQSAIAGLGGDSAGTRSGNTSFSLFGGATVSPGTVLQEYRKTTAAASADGPAGLYLPKDAVSQAATPYVAQQNLPLTGLGRSLDSLGVPVPAINATMRNVIAYCEQLFLLLGLSRLLILRWRQRRPVGRDLLWLSLGSLGMVGLITVLPAISADYGVLRAFEEALIFFCPVVVVGSETLFLKLGKRPAQVASALLCLGLFANTSGLVPQLLGGNLAELNLNNSGTYYDLYYMRPQDEAAVSWLGSQPHAASSPVQSGYLQTKYLFTSPATVNGKQAITDDYPTLLLRNSWVILGYPTVGNGLAYTYTRFNGDLIEYKYPIGLLNGYKNLVYANGQALIYK